MAHLGFVGVLLLIAALHLGEEEQRKPSRPPSAISMRPLSADQWERNRGAQSQPSPSGPMAQRPREEKKQEPKPEPKRPDGQVVDVAPGNQQKAPDAKYLAEHDNKVEKETRAREQTPNYRNAMPQRTAPQAQAGSGQQQAQAPTTPGNNGLAADDRPLTEAGRRAAMELPDARRRNEIALKTDPTAPGPGVELKNRNQSDELSGNSKRLRIQPGLPGGEEQGSSGRLGSPGMAALMPSQATLDKVIGAAPNDRLKDVEEGDGTLLNTREWKYASFFNRVKQSVGMHWDPNVQLQRRDPTGNTYSGRDRYTLLNVVLDERGRVQDVTVEKSSGLDFLDLEAIASFHKAQPFPNPPPGLLDGDSRVKFTFGFYLDMGGGPRMRLFRQPN
ncbi:energy transducer TonB [Myxococcaceae bacterium GXIMD 01537]